ncbi:hypothetical protein F1C76_02130 [Geodermatophilaceae bacterium NBWT11]|nr:hypothetical protein F1C76_02130 [Geodermatophilaceae bacterium NBWT11]
MTTRKPVEGTVIPPAAKTMVTSADALGALNNIVDALREYGRTKEVEQSKREELDVYRTVEVAKIDAARRTLESYLANAFAERSRTTTDLFTRFDEALSRGDDTAAAAVLVGIVDIAKSSPLAAMGDLGQIRKALDDPNHEWKF